MTKFKKASLFGGAITVDLPATFADVSKVRPVPDNQEVWIDQDGFTSVIFDITERVDRKGASLEDDGKALATHLEELIDPAVDALKVWNTVETQFTRLGGNFPAYTLIATQSPLPAAKRKQQQQDQQPPQLSPRPPGNDSTPGEASPATPGAPDFTAIILTLLRLERESTDLLVTINVPHIRGTYDADDIDLELGKQGKLIGDAVEFAARIWESFQVEDWNLFNEI